jgi:hypothetical protein
MSIWPILILGVLSAYFAWHREKLFGPSRRKNKELSNKSELLRSLDALIDFLSKQEEFKWGGILRGIQTDLQSQSTEAQALSRLSDTFGGMGSLNDLVFDEADDEGGRLLDDVFRDMKLYYGTPEHHAEWKKLEEEHKGELPPRIKHAFRKE